MAPSKFSTRAGAKRVLSCTLLMVLLVAAKCESPVSQCDSFGLCDANLKGRPILQHPNVAVLDDDPPTTVPYATGERTNTNVNETSFWTLTELWSSFPIIENQVDLVVQPGKWDDTNLSRFLKDEALELPMPGVADPSAAQLDLMDVYTTHPNSKAVFFNPEEDPELAERFGRITLGHKTTAEYFHPHTYQSLVADGTVAQLEAEYQQDPTHNADLAALLIPLLNRDEKGFQTSGSCTAVELTFDPAPSYYCKWPHLAIKQETRPTPDGIPLLTGTLNLRAKFRVFGIQENQLNKYLKAADLSAAAMHFNMRARIRRERTNPITFEHPTKGTDVTRTHDAVWVNMPLFEAHDLCQSSAWDHLDYCQRVGARAPGASIINDQPDVGSATFIYKMGRLEQYGDEPTAIARLNDIADGKWVTMQIDDLPMFGSLLASASTGCEALYPPESQGLCDIESTNWREYSISSVSLAWETRGTWTGAIALKGMKAEVD